jgi:hypothetical protein
VALLAIAFSSADGRAAPIIDFEFVPGGSAIDNLQISTQYRAAFGVEFGLDIDGDGLPDAGAFPRLEQTGGSDADSGFDNQLLGVYDTAFPGFESQLGDFFLRGDPPLGGPFGLIISYSSAVAAASGEIWDIDVFLREGTERWRIDALGNDFSTVVDSVLSPLGDGVGLTGKPWVFSFDHGATADIHALRLVFVGSKTTGIGVGFNNFSSSTPIPEPSALVMFSIGLVIIGWQARTHAG